MRRSLVAALLGMTLTGGVQAHPLAPAMLELTETGPQRYAVLWRTPVARTRAQQDVTPRLPAHCQPVAPPDVRVESNEALVMRWVAQCGPGGIDGATIAVDGLSGSGINVIVRAATRDGREASALLGADQPAATLALAAPSPFVRYFALGGEHLLTGLDHLLFLLGLFVLVPTLRMLVATVTAFTVGHSLTLAAAVLGWLQVRQGWAELAIAATLVVLALELARSRKMGRVYFPQENGPVPIFRRRPWLLAGGFGLIHGLGFAGALREVGVPAGDIPISLMAFNIGIEAGQLALVAALLAVATIWRKMDLAAGWVSRRKPIPHLIGAMGVCWCLERSLPLLG